MPKTRSAASLLGRLGEDLTCVVLTFLPVDAIPRVREMSRQLLALSGSERLSRLRRSQDYAVRYADAIAAPSHGGGIVHALATAFGTKAWPTESFEGFDFLHQDFFSQGGDPSLHLHVVPSEMEFTLDGDAWSASRTADDFQRYFKCVVVSPRDLLRHLNIKLQDTGHECDVGPGAHVEIRLPFVLSVDWFRLSYGDCCREHFKGWAFEAFDRVSATWAALHTRDFCEIDGPGARDSLNRVGHIADRIDELVANMSVGPFESDRFRIRILEDHVCFHIQGLELFGTIRGTG